MNDYTEFYYALSTIPQVLAAFLGLSSIFLIYTYGQLKDELIGVAFNIWGILNKKYKNQNDFKSILPALKVNIDAKSTKSIITILKSLFENEKYIIDKRVKEEIIQNPNIRSGDEKIQTFVEESESYANEIILQIDKTNESAKRTLYFGAPSIILSIILIPLIPNLLKWFLYVSTAFLIILSIISMLFMVKLIFEYIRHIKDSFS